MMTSGIPEMQVWLADSLVSPQNVRGLLNNSHFLMLVMLLPANIPLTLTL